MEVRFFKSLGIFYAVFTLIGLTVFLLEDAGLAYTRDVRTEVDGARPYARGYQVRASSWDVHNEHHILYAIDGEPQPSRLEKWASMGTDRAPWIQVKLPEAEDIRAVEIVHPGEYESERLDIPDYDITCLSNTGEQLKTIEVRDNTANMARHEVNCSSTRSMKVSFYIHENPQHLRGVARVYEITPILVE